MNPMVGPYLYIILVLAGLALLGFKMYLQSRSPIDSHRPASPISPDDIAAAVRGKRIVEAIQLYGLLHQCDLAEATQAVQDMVAQLKADEAAEAAEAASIDPGNPEETPPDHRET